MIVSEVLNKYSDIVKWWIDEKITKQLLEFLLTRGNKYQWTLTYRGMWQYILVYVQ